MGGVPVNSCPVCSGKEFQENKVLWPELVDAWQLSFSEVEYINRQQGLICLGCGANLRSMALANAIVRAYGFDGNLIEFCNSPISGDLQILEVNPAGTLTKHLISLPGHQLVSYPEYDMKSLAFDSKVFDLVIHSDTLEHIDQPIKAMEECRRVLKDSGRCLFTIPIIVGRLSRSREGLKPSFHGCETDMGADLLVQSEFGADFWRIILKAGFESCAIHSLEYPAGLAIAANC